MKAIVGLVTELKIDTRVVSLDSIYYDDSSTPIEFYNFDVVYDETITDEGLRGLIVDAILAHAVTQSYSITDEDISFLVGGLPMVFGNPTRSPNTTFQISLTRPASVTYAVDILCEASLAGGEEGEVFLEYADDNGFTTNVVAISAGRHQFTGTLLVGLTIQSEATAHLSGFVPTGKYVRIRTANVTGTPVFTLRSEQQEVLL